MSITIADRIEAILTAIPTHYSRVASDSVALLPSSGSSIDGRRCDLDTAALRDIYRAIIHRFRPTPETITEAGEQAAFISGAGVSLPDMNGNERSVAYVAGLIYAVSAVCIDDEEEDLGPSYGQATAALWEC